MNKKIFAFLITAFISVSPLLADDAEHEIQIKEFKKISLKDESYKLKDENCKPIAQKNDSDKEGHKRKKNTSGTYNPESRKAIHFTWIGNIQPARVSLFTQVNIGVGFLYFSGVTGNLSIEPPSLPPQVTNPVPFQRGFSYNKTPLFEYMVGYRILHWLKAAVSFQTQQGITVETKAIPVALQGNSPLIVDSQVVKFSSFLGLNAIMARAFFELPWPLVVKSVAMSPYLSAGVGGGWQSWTNMSQIDSGVTGALGTVSGSFPLKQKISANVVLLADAGFRFQPATTLQTFSLTFGCKYNYWGAARNLGLFGEQGSRSIGLFKPLRIKNLYSFAPYAGFQWNFADVHPSKLKNSRKEQTLWQKNQEAKHLLFTQYNIGPNFLYASNTQGVLGINPPNLFPAAGGAKLRGRLKYNKTPLFEYLIGFQPLKWFKYAVSIQNQQDISLETPLLPTQNPQSTVGEAKLNAQLELNSVMAKVYFQWYLSIDPAFYIAPYISAGVGGGWQSWTDISLTMIAEGVGRTTGTGSYNFVPFREKISLSCAWMADVGINFIVPGYYFPFHLSVGCKYNQWGKSPNIGKLSQQGTLKVGMLHPYSIKTLYSFAPYLALEWDFPVRYDYVAKNKTVDKWMPFVCKVSEFQKRTSFFTNANIGVGILGFDRIRLNAGSFPNAVSTGISSAPFKGKMRYNIAPTFEYMTGYRVLQWLSLAFSYNTQSNVFIETDFLINFGPVINPTGGSPTAGNPSFAKLQARLGLNMLLFKPVFEWPFPMVWKGWITSPYVAPGVGAAWQSWTSVTVTYASQGSTAGPFFALPYNLKQKIIPDLGLTLDCGLRIRNAVYNAPLSIVVGCKYNQWGQTVNLGQLTQQDGLKLGLFKPLRIRAIYSFAPYLGVQWNF